MLGGNFQLYSNFDIILCKQIVENQIRRSVQRRLVRFSSICLQNVLSKFSKFGDFTKKDARLKWVKRKIINIFLFISENICFRFSKEPSQ